MVTQFKNRTTAGQKLAMQLTRYAGRPDVVILALPRGGVPVAFEVAKLLQAPLDICLVRKLGVPGHRELAMGAIATGGVRVLNPEVIQELEIPNRTIAEVTARELQELERRNWAYRGSRPALDVYNRIVILIDDGLATGSTMRAAIVAIRQQHPKSIIVAVPIGAPEVCQALKTEADEVICLVTPKHLQAIGLWYEDFSQTTDSEVQSLLANQPSPELV